MNYKIIYEKLIARAKQRKLTTYTEKHHIIPRCIGGSDEKSNLVRLTPEEHFFAHILLVKIYPEQQNLILAVQKMSVSSAEHDGHRKRKIYGWLRRKHSNRMREISNGERNSQFGTIWINDGSINKKIHKEDPLPSGWIRGKVKKPRSVSRGKGNHGATKGYRYLGKSKATDEEVRDALIKNDLDINKAMESLGYKQKTFGNSRTRFIKIRASLV